jgi:hypothetical protein
VLKGCALPNPNRWYRVGARVLLAECRSPLGAKAYCQADRPPYHTAVLWSFSEGKGGGHIIHAHPKYARLHKLKNPPHLPSIGARGEGCHKVSEGGTE